jgi:hypothetical protein
LEAQFFHFNRIDYSNSHRIFYEKSQCVYSVSVSVET